MDFTLTFPAERLPLLAPDGVTARAAWVVCFAHRPDLVVNGQPALGGVDAWHPLGPCPSQEAAEQWAERYVRATLDAGDALEWAAIYDEAGNATEARELFVVLEDGTEHQADVAIAPLAMLAR